MSSTIDPRVFRETLGHFPTGVVVVTGIDQDGAPAGMVIGSFTSVSLSPPLVAFLPTKESGSFARLRSGSSFCVNVLASDQEDTCRRFASRIPDKFEGAGWTPAPGGAPILDGVVAWIECDFEDVIDAGDHYIVLGRVTDMGVPRPALPLLFFQGGYGRFSPPSLVAPSDPGIIDAVRFSERVRPALEGLAADLGADCSVLASVGADAVFVATANRSTRRGLISVGTHMPLLPPLGSVFLTEGSDEEMEAWLARAPRLDDDTRSVLRGKADRVRERGYSVSLRAGRPTDDDFEGLLTAYAAGEHLPQQERQLKEALAGAAEAYEPELTADTSYDVHSLVVGLPREDDQPKIALRLANLPREITDAEIAEYADRLRSIAQPATPAQ